MARDRFSSGDPRAPTRSSKAMRIGAPSTHGLKREGDNNNSKAGNPMARVRPWIQDRDGNVAM
jgi:hypothetical protein